MVTAGIYMVARSNVFLITRRWRDDCAVIGALTAISRHRSALFRPTSSAFCLLHDFAARIHVHGLRRRSIFGRHLPLMTHAFFKALLFLSAGSVIHALGGEQDMRHMGGLRKLHPVTSAAMAVGTIAIAGIPPFAGFFSKDEISGKPSRVHQQDGYSGPSA